ncbi:MAG: alpha/beta hydrolase [Thiothrix litoralis]|uniref:hypothetical protein n=1 Tax=Thiothrix litoralis TaxID=2891210 RepID=UPI003C78C51E
MHELTDPAPKLEPFFIEYSSIYLHGDILPKDADVPPEVLCLHGGGAEGRSSFLLLRHVLLQKYLISSCAFDFLGYGGTSGASGLVEQYQQEHLNQTTDIVDACFDSQPFSIVASDISAGVALQLAKSFPVRQLVLLNPPNDQDVTGDTPCQSVAMPIEAAQTLAYMNSHPAVLLKIAQLVKNTLHGNSRYVRCNYP